MTAASPGIATGTDLVDLRRRLHRIPELGLQVPQTQAIVLEALAGLPLEITTGDRLTSVTAVLRGGRPGPVVLLRGDMDALPVSEESGVPFASEVEGRMHACGHDLHTAGLIGAARQLCAQRDELAGDVVFMFQPGEEGFDGAGLMIEEGVLDAAGRPVDTAFALHVLSSMIPRGVVAGRAGTTMAASAALRVRVVGAGGHGSTPHLAADPLPAACTMVTALQTAVTRTFDVFDPVVLSVGTFHAGTQRNIIPADAEFQATIRTFSAATGEKVRRVVTDVCTGIAAAHGVRAEIDYRDVYPATVTDPAAHAFVTGTVCDLFGPDRCTELADPFPASEDFSRVLQRVPGAYFFLGTCTTDDPSGAPAIHSPLATFDDRLLDDSARLLATLALRARTVTG